MSIKEGHNRIVLTIKQPGAEKDTSHPQRILIEVKRTDKGQPYNFKLIKDYTCCESPEYYSVMIHNSGKMDVPLFLIEVAGGCAPYTWSINSQAMAFDIAVTETPYNYIRMIDPTEGTESEGDLVKVTDSCGIELTCLVRICPLQNYDWFNEFPPFVTCEDEEYINPTLVKGAVYDNYLLATQFYQRFNGTTKGINGAGTSYYIPPMLEELGVEQLQPKWIRSADGYPIFSSAYIIKLNEFFDIIEFPNVSVTFASWTDYLIELNGLKCGCAKNAVYTISDGTPPYTVEVYRNGDWEILKQFFYFHKFTWDAFAPQCGDVRKIRVQDLCGNYTNTIELDDLELKASGVIWTNGRDWQKIWSGNCSSVYNFAFQIASEYSYQYCDKDFFFELDSGDGELVVEYADIEQTCVDAILGNITMTTRRPISAYWFLPLGDCCLSTQAILTLYVCELGSQNRQALDTVYLNITGATVMQDDGFPTTIANGAWADAYVTGGKPPYYWTIENLDEGVYGSGFSWDDAVTMVGHNIVRAANDGCGAVKLSVTDSCGTVIYSVLRNTTGVYHNEAGGYVTYLESDDDGGELRSKFISKMGIEYDTCYPYNGGYTYQVTSSRHGQDRYSDNNVYRWIEWMANRSSSFYGTVSCAYMCDNCTAYYGWMCWWNFVHSWNDYVYWDIGSGKGVRAELLWSGPCDGKQIYPSVSGTDCGNELRPCWGNFTSKVAYVFYPWGYQIDIWGCP